jgi:hypothetical protein
MRALKKGSSSGRQKNGSGEKISVCFENGTIDSIDGLRQRPNVVYLGVTQDGLYRTDDAGKKWQRVFEGNVRAVTVDPTDERVVYVGIEPIPSLQNRRHWKALGGAYRRSGSTFGSEKKLEVSQTAASRARPTYFCPSGSSKHYSCLFGTRRHYPQFRSRQDLGGCERRNRLSRHSSHQQRSA